MAAELALRRAPVFSFIVRMQIRSFRKYCVTHGPKYIKLEFSRVAKTHKIGGGGQNFASTPRASEREGGWRRRASDACFWRLSRTKQTIDCAPRGTHTPEKRAKMLRSTLSRHHPPLDDTFLLFLSLSKTQPSVNE